MKRIVLLLVSLWFGSLSQQTVWAQNAGLSKELESLYNSLSPGQQQTLRQNKYFTESLRLINLARLAMINNEFEKSMTYSAQAMEQAALSDAYIQDRLTVLVAGRDINTARDRLQWAEDSGASDYYPEEYGEAKAHYASAESAQAEKKWREASAEANLVLESLKDVLEPEAFVTQQMNAAHDRLQWAESSGGAKYYPNEYEEAKAHYATAESEQAQNNLKEAFAEIRLVFENLEHITAPPAQIASIPPEELSRDDFPEQPQNPIQYVVRPWDVYGDCFWNIAQWFYGDPWLWPLLYEGNKEKLPDINNPNLVLEGTVIIIPPLNNEERSGTWDTGLNYPPLSNTEDEGVPATESP
jgi:nucleoid-associated protein YgaU